jgi:GNAT superfamily N-acetyltransferase
MEPVGERLQDRPTPGVVDAVTANWIEFYAHLGEAPEAEFSAGPPIGWLLTGISDAFLNVVFRTELPRDRPGDVIDDALAHVRARRIAALSWLNPGSDVGRLLAARGLTLEPGGTAMAADLAAVPDAGPSPEGVAIEAVRDDASLRSWVDVMRIGFGTPEVDEPALFQLFAGVRSAERLLSFLALLDGRPVATSQLFLGTAVAGIYNVTCRPEARGRGIGTAVTAVALLEARRRGFGTAILQASDVGRPVYTRLGFRDYGRLGEYRFSLER